MYIKRYTIAAFFLIVLVGWYVYAFITKDSVSIDLLGVTLPSLSIAIWVMVPLIALYIASVIHMSFYSFLGSLRLRKYDKDYEKIIDSMVDAYLGKAVRSNTFKTSRYKLLGSLIDNTVLVPNNELSADTSDEKINEVVRLIENINNGEVVDLKKYNLLPSNALVIQNEKNRYIKGDVKAEDILGHSDKYDTALLEDVYTDFVKVATLSNIEKYKDNLNKLALFEILARINADENSLEISNEVLISILNSLELDKADYIKISTTLSKGMIPEQRIKLFEMLSEEKEEAMDAYLFTLFDLEMLAPVKEILDISQDYEYQNFKAYAALRECGKHYNINLFI